MELLFAAMFASLGYGADTSGMCSVRELRTAPGYLWSVERIGQFVDSADVIVRVRAVAADSSRPSETIVKPWPTGVRFEVLERLRGDVGSPIVLSGFVVLHDDYNKLEVPYRLVRGAGQRGDCFASEYRLGAEYLLIMRQRADGLTPHWWPLAPANEQLRGATDPWLRWVTKRVQRNGIDPPALAPVARIKRARDYVIPGALLGAFALTASLGTALYNAEAGSRLVVYGGTALVGGLTGAIIGRILFDARR
jgi:hypothetical protein